jgi:hypothetical protein
MQQTVGLDEVLDHPSRADRQPSTGDHTAVSAETSELVARACTGDQVAWEQLVDRYGGLVWAVARARGLGPQDAGAVSQVTWPLQPQHHPGQPANRPRSPPPPPPPTPS